MKILFLTHRLPFPPDKGDKIRSFHILKYLAARHEVHLVCWADGASEIQAADKLKELIPNMWCVRFQPKKQRMDMLKALVSGKPLSVHYFYAAELKKQVDEVLQKTKFDALFVYSSNMAEYVLDANIPNRIIDFCDLDSEKFNQYSDIYKPPKSWLCKFEGRRLGRYEEKVARKFDHVFFINPIERHLFSNGHDDRKTSVLSNGVDLNHYFGDDLPDDPAKRTLDGDVSIVFTGSMDYIPNIDAATWFAKSVFPKIKAIIPEAQFHILGRNPAKNVRKLNNPERSVFVSGYVEDLRTRIKEATVFVAPMRIARGMQTKILEAMACGVPVVTSKASAKGIGAWPGREVLVADTEAEFAKQVLILLLNHKMHEGLRKRAFEFLKQKFNWENNLCQLDRFIPTSKQANEHAQKENGKYAEKVDSTSPN